MRKIISTSIFAIGLLLTTVQPVLAQFQVDPDGSGGLKSITVPTFLSIDRIQSFSIFSYIAFGLSLFFVGLTIYWVYLIIKNAVKIVQSQGDDGKVKEGAQGIRAIFIGIAMMFGFFIVLFIVGSFFGMGSIFSWPKKLSICKGGEMYITLALQAEHQDKSEDDLDAACFN